MLQHWGNVGPAEIETKRVWTFRHVHWLAATHDIALDTPAVHPFNPLLLSRLALASAADFRPNRRVVEETVQARLDRGRRPGRHDALAELTSRVAPVHDPAGPAVKQALRDNTESALAAGVFGVPTIEVEGRCFWGLDALPMVRDATDGRALVPGSGLGRSSLPREGVVRVR
jgi:2-hydroxychromene-2-carboxylate isomerase